MTSAAHDAAVSAMPSKPALQENLLSTIHRTGHFKHLMAAVKAAGLGDALNGEGPFTLFAPNDRAFDRIAASELADLLKPESQARLAALLNLHVVSGLVTMAVPPGEPFALQSLQGESLNVDTSQRLTVNKARVVERDIQASNGVIHVIDTVLMPASR